MQLNKTTKKCNSKFKLNCIRKIIWNIIKQQTTNLIKIFDEIRLKNFNWKFYEKILLEMK